MSCYQRKILTVSNDNPLSVLEYERLFKLLHLVSNNVERLLNYGTTMNEGSNDQQLQSAQDKIETYRDRIRKEQERIQRIRAFIAHRKQIDRKTNWSLLNTEKGLLDQPRDSHFDIGS